MLHKIKLLYLLAIAAHSIIYGQSYTDSVISKIKIDYPFLSVEQVEDGIIKVTYPDGMERLENVLPYLNRKIPEGIGYTVIDVPNTDTIPFFWKYKLWQQLYLTQFAHRSIKSADVNRNDLQELYGFQYIDGTPYPAVVFEKNETDHYSIVYSYPRGNLYVQSIYDIDQDGNLEVGILDSVSFNEKFYSKPVKDSLATHLFFTSNDFTGIEPIMGNFDGDSLTDFAPSIPPRISILEYNPSITNFDTVYSLLYDWHNYDFLVGFAIGDFDHDKRTELVSGDVRGSILVIENTGDNSYDTTWSGIVSTHNAYNQTQTDDIDGNGKPEFWVMGYSQVTTITIFEAVGDNQYSPVGIIDLLGVASFTVGNLQPVDIDQDGVDEMVVSVDGYVIILKFTGSVNQQQYSIYYLKKVGEGYHFQNAVMYSLGISHEKELLFSFYKFTGLRTDFTEIYIASDDTLTSVGIDEIQSTSNYLVNYPNPFNISTVIKFNIVESGEAKIKIYNSLGEEVNTLLDKFLSPGSYEISWEGKNKQEEYLPSGLYFITLNSGGRFSTIKTILLK